MGKIKEKGKTWPSIREARWWILIGAVYGLLSLVPLANETVRETLWSSLQDVGGPFLVGVVAGLLPAVWAIFLTSPLPHTESLLFLATPLSAFLGSLVAYLLKALFNGKK